MYKIIQHKKYCKKETNNDVQMTIQGKTEGALWTSSILDYF